MGEWKLILVKMDVRQYIIAVTPEQERDNLRRAWKCECRSENYCKSQTEAKQRRNTKEECAEEPCETNEYKHFMRMT